MADTEPARRYAVTMAAYEEAWEPVCDRLRTLSGHPAQLWQTGGMCMAAAVLLNSGYLLITSYETGTLPCHPADNTGGWEIGYFCAEHCDGTHVPPPAPASQHLWAATTDPTGRGLDDTLTRALDLLAGQRPPRCAAR